MILFLLKTNKFEYNLKKIFWSKFMKQIYYETFLKFFKTSEEIRFSFN